MVSPKHSVVSSRWSVRVLFEFNGDARAVTAHILNDDPTLTSPGSICGCESVLPFSILIPARFFSGLHGERGTRVIMCTHCNSGVGI